MPQYKGLSVPARQAEASDEDVEKELDKLRERAARFEPIEGRPSKDGDFVEVDVEWTRRAAANPDATRTPCSRSGRATTIPT